MADPQESVEVEGPGGIKGKFTGRNAILLIMLVVLGFGVWGVWEHRAESSEGHKGTQRQQESGFKDLGEKVDRLTDAQREATYVLTLTERERKELKLDMPESLRRRTR